MKVELDINLEKFRYSLVGDGYIKDEVVEMSEDKLITILNDRVKDYIDVEYDQARRYGLLD